MKKYILLLAAIVLAAAAAILLPPLFGNEMKEPLLADIVQDGKLLRTIDLANAPDEEFTVEYRGAVPGENRIRIEKGEMYVAEADCPDRICIGSGKLRKNGPPIVCLPHKLVIRYREAGGIDGTAR